MLRVAQTKAGAMIAKITPVLVNLEELGKRMTGGIAEKVPSFLREEATTMMGVLTQAARHYSDVVGGSLGDKAKDLEVEEVLGRSKKTVRNYKNAIDTAHEAIATKA